VSPERRNPRPERLYRGSKKRVAKLEREVWRREMWVVLAAGILALILYSMWVWRGTFWWR
jgi:hypothetical protein